MVLSVVTTAIFLACLTKLLTNRQPRRLELNLQQVAENQNDFLDSQVNLFLGLAGQCGILIKLDQLCIPKLEAFYLLLLFYSKFV